MDLSHDDVLEILQLIDRSSVSYLELQVGDTRIVADRDGGGPRVVGELPPSTGRASTPASPPTERTAPVESTAPEVSSPSAEASPSTPVSRAVGDDPDVVTVTAPVVGVFYRAPEPGADPYVDVGERVEVGATLGLVEVMKMFNGVTADVEGVVVDILVENEEFVEFGQPLMTIRSEPSA